jgi:histidyl-tRNA synthetase
MANIQPRIFKGARDFLPEKMIPREEILKTMRAAFQKYGFEPIETPAIEYLEVLAGKYGDDADRLIYRLNYKTGTKDEAALHYDLTVPLSRVIAMNPNLPKPFKRYQIQPVWRADTPQPHQGRFREFYQCDCDTVGSTSMLCDAEIIAVSYEVLNALGFERFLIKINNRKILNGLVQYIGLDASRTGEVCRSIDKLDKMPFEAVAKELREKNFSDEAIERLQTAIEGEQSLAHFRKVFADVPLAQEGIEETEQLFAYLDALGVSRDSYAFHLSLARGLDYYTGPIFETVLPEHPHIGSLTGGGRYDTLIGVFNNGKNTPAVGTALGLDRIFTAMEQLNMLPKRVTRTKALVVLFDETTRIESIRLMAELRAAGINTEMYPDKAKLGKQFGFADTKGIPYVVIAGEDELARGEVTVKTLASGEQITLSRSAVVDWLNER